MTISGQRDKSLDDFEKFTPFGSSGSPVSSTRVSHDEPPPSLEVKGVGLTEYLSELCMDYQITARPLFKLERKGVSLILSVLVNQIVRQGCDFTQYLVCEYLYSWLLGSKQDPLEIRDQNERKTVVLAQTVLKNLRGEWLRLKDKKYLTPNVEDELRKSGWLLNDRTLWSRVSHYRPERWIEVRAVVLDVFLEKERNSEPYSSYCKGYGEAHRTARSKTPVSSELDGEPSDRPEVVIPLDELQTVLKFNFLNLKFNIQRRKKY